MATGFVERIKGKIRAHIIYLGAGGIVPYGATVAGPAMFPNAGAPTNGTNGSYAGYANPGDLLSDTTNGNLYQNVGTKVSPTWSPFASASDAVVYPAQDTLTAHSGGGQASATQLNYGLNRLSVCALANDSVALPAATVGAMCWLANDGVAATKVFGKNGNTDTIDGVAGATGVPLTNAKRAFFHCLTAGAWVSQQGGVSA
jgi:hypothetical protein